MEHMISSLVSRYETGTLTRRDLIQGLSLLFAAQGSNSGDVIRVASINHVSLQVSDIQRSAAFYTRTFGLINEGSDANTARLASGKCHVSIRHGNPVGIVDHFAFGINRFNESAVTAELKRRGADARNEGQFGLHVVDPDGVRVQISENDERHRV
jgi:catechol 2,3-dioxygenase-like lactoylglutathione lyase family enzyme